MNFPARLAGLVSSFSDSDYAPISGACQWECRESTQPTRSVIRLEPVTQPTRRRTAREFNFYFGFVGAGGGSRTLIPSEGCGILSPVRLPVPPLQQVYDSLEFTSHSGHAHCNGSCNGRDGHYSTLRSRRPIPPGTNICELRP